MTSSFAGLHDLASQVPTGLIDVMPLQSGGGFLWLAVLFLVLAVVAGLLGARGVAGFSMEIARILVIVFIILAIVTFLL